MCPGEEKDKRFPGEEKQKARAHVKEAFGLALKAVQKNRRASKQSKAVQERKARDTAWKPQECMHMLRKHGVHVIISPRGSSVGGSSDSGGQDLKSGLENHVSDRLNACCVEVRTCLLYTSPSPRD
eukprot:8270557-Alexandrium_andersonii.AAC.1